MIEIDDSTYPTEIERFQYMHKRVDNCFALYIDLRNYMDKIAFVVGIFCILIFCIMAVLFGLVMF